jgi:hypothetical protein
MEERDASPNEPKTAANPGKVPKLSSFAEEARTTETEERERETLPPTNPTKPQIPAKCLKCLRSLRKHGQQKRTRNSQNDAESSQNKRGTCRVMQWRIFGSEPFSDSPRNRTEPNRMLWLSTFVLLRRTQKACNRKLWEWSGRQPRVNARLCWENSTRNNRVSLLSRLLDAAKLAVWGYGLPWTPSLSPLLSRDFRETFAKKPLQNTQKSTPWIVVGDPAPLDCDIVLGSYASHY